MILTCSATNSTIYNTNPDAPVPFTKMLLKGAEALSKNRKLQDPPRSKETFVSDSIQAGDSHFKTSYTEI